MTEKQRTMIQGMDMLLRKFSRYPNDKSFTVEEIINASNEVYDNILNDIEVVNPYKRKQKVQNGDGYYDSEGRYRSYAKDSPARKGRSR